MDRHALDALVASAMGAAHPPLVTMPDGRVRACTCGRAYRFAGLAVRHGKPRPPAEAPTLVELGGGRPAVAPAPEV
jgi:hypothetical protein